MWLLTTILHGMILQVVLGTVLTVPLTRDPCLPAFRSHRRLIYEHYIRSSRRPQNLRPIQCYFTRFSPLAATKVVGL